MNKLCISDLLVGCQLTACSYEANPELWSEVLDDLPYQPNYYSHEMIQYQHSYYADAGWDLSNFSLILLTDGRPCGVLPLTIKMGDEPRVTSLGLPILSPIFLAWTPEKTIKKIFAWLYDFLGGIHAKLGLNTMYFEQQPIEPSGGIGLSLWQQFLMSRGCDLKIQHELYVDLGSGVDVIFSGFRKSYKPLITKAERLWDRGLITADNANEEVWAEFRKLHLQVSGRITRSSGSWDNQYKAIISDKAFLVFLRDPTTAEMVGAGYFQVTRDEGIYSVGAYKRELFGKPIGHLVQFLAIQEMLRRQLKWYRLGVRNYQQDKPAPSIKEVAISEFKQGFSSHVFLRYLYEVSLQNE